MRIVEFRNILDENNALRVKFELNQGNVTSFVVQLECNFGDKYVPVIRYDTAHNIAHCDKLHPYRETEKIEMNIQDYNESLTFAMQDLKENWFRYRRRYERWIKKE